MMLSNDRGWECAHFRIIKRIEDDSTPFNRIFFSYRHATLRFNVVVSVLRSKPAYPVNTCDLGMRLAAEYPSWFDVEEYNRACIIVANILDRKSLLLKGPGTGNSQ
jgi:hypothetical protein